MVSSSGLFPASQLEVTLPCFTRLLYWGVSLMLTHRPQNYFELEAGRAMWSVADGGSRRDQESIAACDQHGIAMAFAGVRHFRH